MPYTLVALAVTSIVAAGPIIANHGQADGAPGALTAARKQLEGRWRLMSFDITPPGRDRIQVLGAGTLVYDAHGNLSVEIRVDGNTANLLETAGIHTDRGVLSTTGRTTLDLQRRTLTYVLEGQPATGAPSGPLALNRPRHYQVDQNVLTLTTSNDEGQVLSVGRWQKAP